MVVYLNKKDLDKSVMLVKNGHNTNIVTVTGRPCSRTIENEFFDMPIDKTLKWYKNNNYKPSNENAFKGEYGKVITDLNKTFELTKQLDNE